MPAGAGDRINVEIVRAWPRRFVATELSMPVGATVADALAAEVHAIAANVVETQAQLKDVPTALAVFGERVELSYVLADGDRIEILRPLLADPKDARRNRAKR